MDPLFEKRLIQGLKKKDAIAFEKFVEMYQKDIYNLSLRFLGNEQDALDITQELFIKVLKKIDTFEGNSKLSTWVYRITVNYCKDFVKKNRRRTHISLDKPIGNADGDFLNEIEDGGPTPQTILEKKLENELLQNAIESLEGEQKEIIILRYINELSYSEIGEILKLPEGTIKSRLSRARKKLAEILKKRGT